MEEKRQTETQIEEEIHTVLDPVFREDALAFISYLRKSGMKPHQWFGPGFWIVPGENRNLFGIHFYGLKPQSTGTGWVLWFFASNYANTENEELIQLVFDHVGHCIKCSAACEVQGVDMNFFGRAYTNICYQFPVRFNNPDSETLQKVKLLIDFCQKTTANSSGLYVQE